MRLAAGHLSATRVLALSVVVLACAARLVILDADPDYYGWITHMYDEGRWVEHARSLAQQGRLLEGGDYYHLMLGSLFQLASYISFVGLGVSRIAARLFPAICGGILIAFLWSVLRRSAGELGALAGVAIVAFQADMVVFSRLALPYIPAVLIQLLVLAVLTARAPSWKRCLAAGVLATLGTGFGVLGFYFLPIGAMLAFGADPDARVGRRVANIAAYSLSGFAIVAAVLAVSAPVWTDRAPELVGQIGYMLRLIKTNGAYVMLARALDYPTTPVLATAMVGVWIAALARFAGGPFEDARARRTMRAASVWLGLFFFMSLVFDYFPSRYQILALVPIALLAGLGTSAVVGLGWTGLARGLGAPRGWSGALAAGLLALPSAVIASPLVGLVMQVEAGRLRWRVVCLAVSVVLAVPVVRRWRGNPVAVAALVVAPVVWALLWLAAWALLPQGVPFWQTAAGPAVMISWSGFTLGAGVAAAAAAAGARAGQAPSGRWFVPAAALLLTGLWIGHLLPGFLRPQYAVRDASREIGRLLAGAESVEQTRAEGLFIDNAVPFRPLWDAGWGERGPSHLVVMFKYLHDVERLQEFYRPLVSFDLALPSRQRVVDPKDRGDNVFLWTPEGHHVTVYVRKP